MVYDFVCLCITHCIPCGAELAVPKGFEARMKQIAQEQGYSSYNSYVVEAIKEKYKRHNFFSHTEK